MPVYDSAMYGEKIWFAYELKDMQGIYNEEYRLLMRKESQKLCFTCPECRENMMLCAGNMVEPYFRHYHENDCVRKSIPGTGMALVARRMIYHILRSSFPEGEIEAAARLNCEGIKRVDIRADFLVTLPGGKLLAATYLSYERKLAEWEETHLICQSVGIEDVWFLNARHFWGERRTTFEYMVSMYYPKRFYIDYETGRVQVRENIGNGGKREELVEHCFPLQEFKLGEDGTANVFPKDILQKKDGVSIILNECRNTAGIDAGVNKEGNAEMLGRYKPEYQEGSADGMAHDIQQNIQLSLFDDFNFN